MKIFTSVKELRAALAKVEPSGIGFVPTMGALHTGHRSLVERARRENDTVVVSVFVNPTQFNDKNDLKYYPPPRRPTPAHSKRPVRTSSSCLRSRRSTPSPTRGSSTSGR